MEPEKFDEAVESWWNAHNGDWGAQRELVFARKQTLKSEAGPSPDAKTIDAWFARYFEHSRNSWGATYDAMKTAIDDLKAAINKADAPSSPFARKEEGD